MKRDFAIEMHRKGFHDKIRCERNFNTKIALDGKEISTRKL